jgi:hypothetical protein
MRFDNWRRENYRTSNLKRQHLPNTMKNCPRETGGGCALPIQRRNKALNSRSQTFDHD